jgi:hypothetical protein
VEAHKNTLIVDSSSCNETKEGRIISKLMRFVEEIRREKSHEISYLCCCCICCCGCCCVTGTFVKLFGNDCCV